MEKAKVEDLLVDKLVRLSAKATGSMSAFRRTSGSFTLRPLTNSIVRMREVDSSL